MFNTQLLKKSTDLEHLPFFGDINTPSVADMTSPNLDLEREVPNSTGELRLGTVVKSSNHSL